MLHQLSNLLVPKQEVRPAEAVTNTRILEELIASFEASLNQESIGTRLLFNAHYLIIMHPTSYEARLAAFPAIVDEAVKAFSAILRKRKRPQDQILPVASHWFFKFGPGTEFEGRSIGLDDLEVIGSLSGLAPVDNLPVAAPTRTNQIKATRRVKNTNIYENLDTNLAAFQHIDFREAGAFSVLIDPNLIDAPAPAGADASAPMAPVAAAAPVPAAHPSALARIDCFLADKNVEETHWMQDREVVVSRKEPENEAFANYIRLDSPYVSNPHARIRYNEAAGTFQVASFSRNETRLNERVVSRSEPASPQWVDMPAKAQILLNGIVTLSFQSLI